MNQHSQDIVQRDSHELTTSTPIGYLAQGSMFWQPDYLQPSAWLEHLPALFWLVEAVQPSRCMTLGVQQGAAHFAMCQAVSRLRLDARCYGVQPRDALDEAATADFQAVRDYHARHYSGVSRLMNTAPQAALEQFGKGSLDLVVFNLPAETDNTASLMELAVSRLSARGVIVLPGIERREPGARLPELFDRLAQQYPAFAFVHGDGMGVVTVDPAPSGTLKNLFEAGETPASRQVLRDVFQRLGRSCADAVEAQQARQRTEQLAREVEQLEQAHERRAEELETLRHRLSEQDKTHARQQGQQEARVEMLQEARDDLRAELRDLLARKTAANDSDSAAAERGSEQAALEQQLEEMQQERDDTQASLEARFNELAQLTRMLEEQRTQGEEAQAERDEARVECEALRKELAEVRNSLQQRFAELATLTEMLEDSEKDSEKKARHALTAPTTSKDAETHAGDPPDDELEESDPDVATAPVPAIGQRDPEASMGQSGSIYQNDPQRLAQDIALLQESDWFDADWYLKRYPDIAKHRRFSREPLLHYLLHGGFEGRNPGPDFDSRFYLQRYADVRKRGTNPLVHYLRYGQQEQRRVRDE
ncbi:class I SAM-dependent methyltransferase [Halomonas piscis]|uniref:class I SAM-dependent methyltransferase n=1 Tax=Halomonas piscis TaxID=3031727 RepID=UPI00289831D0|nr:class I SAM-dependent methyltransferase [Halomonas piscis]